MQDPSKSRLTVKESGLTSGPKDSLRHQLTPWLLDLGSLLLSLACVLAVIALLVHYDNKTAPEWVS